MASYGVPQDEDGLLPWEWARERLISSRNYWLSTVDPNGRPHSMPLWGVWSPDDDRFWFAIATDSLKARNLKSNPYVVVAADDTVEVVSVEGRAEPVGQRSDIARLFGAKYGDSEDEAEELVEFFSQSSMYRLTPTKAFGVIERAEEFSSSATRWVF